MNPENINNLSEQSLESILREDMYHENSLKTIIEDFSFLDILAGISDEN